MIWYKETQEELFKILETSDKGLNDTQVKEKLRQFGPNQLSVRKEPLWKIIVEPFRTVFVAVLGLAAFVSLITGHPLDAAIIGTIIFVNSLIFYTQQYATNRVLRSLKKQSISKVKVVRNSEEVEISSLYIVPGDIIILREGEKVPADCRVIHSDGLQINESSLTGESVPVHKNSSTLQSDHQIYEQDNMTFQGTYVVAGLGKAMVVETGARTEFGKIAHLASDEKSKSPVQEKIDTLITLLVKVIGVLAVLVFMLSLFRDVPSSEALRFVLSLSVSAVPEGLPVALTVIIVLGMRRMANKQALVRSFKAIEDVGLITTIATDKTGTLTKNHLSIVDTWTLNQDDDIIENAKKTIDPQEVNDPLDVAINESSSKYKYTPKKVYQFDLSLRMSGSFDGKDTIFIKGSPEHIISKSNLTKDQKHKAESVMHELASKGYRVIGIGNIKIHNSAPDNLKNIEKLNFTGFLALADELRQEAPQAIKEAKQAGISVRLITGDHYETAYNIGKQVGIASHPSQVIQGIDLPKDPNMLAEAIRDKTVFARILPEDKYTILKALKENEITAMTGDGVNDVPALANAHVGFAMGSGSDIAKDAGGIILLNDNFSTIVKAIREGRKIFDNIRRMLFYLLSTSLGEVLTMVGALLFALPLPITAIQILWINLVTDTCLVLPLGLEPEEKGIMNKPPRKPKDPLLSKMLLSRMVLVALTMAVVVLVIVALLKSRNYSIEYIQTVAFMSLVAAQWMNAFNARGETESFFTRIRTINKPMIVGLIIAIALQMTALFGPLREVFDVQEVSLYTLATTSGIMIVSVLLVVEIHKYIFRKILK